MSIHTSICTCIYSDVAALQVMKPSGCVCPGDTLTYTCTVTGGFGGVTVWTGTAFDCNEIALLHSRFSSAYGIYGTCNNGAIVARSISMEGNSYTSQLNVTVTPDTAGKTVTCGIDNGTTTTFHFTLVIAITGLSSFIAI